MRIRSVSCAAIAIAGGFGFTAGSAFAQPTPLAPPAAEAPVIVPATPPETPVPPAAVPSTLAPVDGGPGAGRNIILMLPPLDGGAAGDRVTMPAGEGTGVRAEILAILMAQFHTMDANGDARLTPEEFAAGWESVFLLLDQNADGMIDATDGAIAAENFAAIAAELREARAAGDAGERGGNDGGGNGGGERRGDGNGGGDGGGNEGERRGDGNGAGDDGRGEGHFEYRRGEAQNWGGHYERDGHGGGSYFFRFPGGFIHLFMTPDAGEGRGHGMPGGYGMPGMGMPGMGMPFFFYGPGFPGMPGMPGGETIPGWRNMPGGGGPNITIQPAPGGDDRNGGGAGGWVAPDADRGGGGTGGWVITPGPNGGPAQVMPVPNTRQAKPTTKP